MSWAFFWVTDCLWDNLRGPYIWTVQTYRTLQGFQRQNSCFVFCSFEDNVLLKLQTAQQAVGVVIIKTCVNAQLSWMEDMSVRCLHQVQRSCEWQGHLKRQGVHTDYSCVTTLQLHVAVHPMQPLKLLYILRRCHAQAKGKWNRFAFLQEVVWHINPGIGIISWERGITRDVLNTFIIQMFWGRVATERICTNKKGWTDKRWQWYFSQYLFNSNLVFHIPQNISGVSQQHSVAEILHK